MGDRMIGGSCETFLEMIRSNIDPPTVGDEIAGLTMTRSPDRPSPDRQRSITPWILAHRGACRVAPENSLAAFDRALAMGADGVELDVRAARDGHLVVVHDASIDGLPIAECDVRSLRLTHPFVSSLEDVLRHFAGRLFLDIELKERGHERRALNLIERYVSPADFMITSFNATSIRVIRAAAPHVKCGLLVGTRGRGARLRSRLDAALAVPRARSAGAQYLCVHWTLVDAGLLARAAGAGLSVIVWTVDDVARLRALCGDARIAAIITNVPDEAIAARGPGRS